MGRWEHPLHGITYPDHVPTKPTTDFSAGKPTNEHDWLSLVRSPGCCGVTNQSVIRRIDRGNCQRWAAWVRRPPPARRGGTAGAAVAAAVGPCGVQLAPPPPCLLPCNVRFTLSASPKGVELAGHVLGRRGGRGRRWSVDRVHGEQARDDRTRLTLEQQSSIVCRHCHQAGAVRNRRTPKEWVNGVKATGALFTGVASVVFAGLSRKENNPAVSCWNCGMRRPPQAPESSLARTGSDAARGVAHRAAHISAIRWPAQVHPTRRRRRQGLQSF